MGVRLQNCEFFFGNCSGVCETSRLFGKKLVISNLFPYYSWPMVSPKDIGIIKKTKFLNKFLNPIDQLDLHLEIILKKGWKGFDDEKFQLIDNSSLEILELAQKALTKFPLKLENQIEYEKLRKQKVSKFLNNYNIAIDTKGKPNKPSKIMLKINNLISKGSVLNL